MMIIVSPKRGHNYYLAVIDVWSSTTVLVDACSLMCWNKSCPFVVPYLAFVAWPSDGCRQRNIFKGS